MEQSFDHEYDHSNSCDRSGRDGVGSALGAGAGAGDVSGMSERFISVEGIARRYAGTTVFEDLWLSIARGEFVCMIGHSGCGKTTVLNILAGLDRPSDGVVIVDGQAI